MAVRRSGGTWYAQTTVMELTTVPIFPTTQDLVPDFTRTRLRVLLVEDNDADAFIVEEILKRSKGLAVETERVRRLDEAMERLAANGIDVVLLDLTLPDSREGQTFTTLNAAHPHYPIIVLSATNDEAMSVLSLRQGAQDYLVKGTVTGESLVRSLRYAVERHRLLAALRGLSLIDELTGLYNRRGFLTLASGPLSLAARRGRRMMLIFGDMNGLKAINDTFGHEAGDTALRAAAEVLRGSFRQSDLVARFGGDEFVVLALEAESESQQLLLDRLAEQFAAFNATSGLPFEVSICAGFVRFEGTAVEAVDEALRQADRELYARKRGRRSSTTIRAVTPPVA